MWEAAAVHVSHSNPVDFSLMCYVKNDFEKITPVLQWFLSSLAPLIFGRLMYEKSCDCTFECSFFI